MSRATQTEITSRHEEILEYAYKYYEKNGSAPLYYNFKKQIGATKKEINSLFPNGLYSIYTWLGIPILTADNPCKPAAKIQVEDYREVHMDHNGTTYIRPEVSDILLKYYSGKLGYGNPSSSSIQGKKAYDLIESSRETIAQCLSVNTEEICFTGSGSEANNLAVKGIAYKNLDSYGHIITSKIEHPSVLRTIEYLEEIGFRATYLDVEKDGIVSSGSVKDALRNDTILVSIMAVNNEIGTINPIAEIGSICREREIPLFVDAVQAFGRMPMLPKEMGISLLSISGHKIYAPKGIGCIFIDQEVEVLPVIHGGDQESGIRAGTENVGHIISLAKAAELIQSEMVSEQKRLKELRDFFLTELYKIEPGIQINGTMEYRVSNNISIAFPGVDSGALLLSLNSIGIYVSAGSACSAGKIETSHVLNALGVDIENYGTIRFSFGLKTNMEDIRYFLKYIPEILKQARE